MKTALITGASLGIGYEMAQQLAAAGTHLVLVARSEQKLQEIAKQLQSKYNIQVTVIAKDLSVYTHAKEVYDVCENKHIKVDYLINNAGFGDFGFFHESDWSKQEQMINLNIITLTYLTRLFVTGMIERKYGRILQVASTASFQPGPCMSVYFATKAYVLHFSEALSNELEGTGVTVTALCPGATISGFQQAAAMENAKLFKNKSLPSSKEVAAYGIKVMMKGKRVAIHGLMNSLLARSVGFMPRGVVLKVSRMLQGI